MPSARGLVLYLVGDYEGSAHAYRTHYKQVYENHPSFPDTHFHALVQGDLAKAKLLAEKELENNSNPIESLLTLGEIALEEKDYKKALDFFSRVFQIKPNHYEALLLSSIAFAGEENYGNAIDSLNQALRGVESQARITSFLRVLEVTGRLSHITSKDRPNCLLAHYHRYLRIFDPANAATAVDYAEKAIQTGDRPDDAHLTIGIVYSKQWDTEKALQHLLKAVAINSKNVEALRWLAIAYEKRGDLANQYRFAKAAYEAAPSKLSYAWWFWYVLTAKLGDYQHALAVEQENLLKIPDDADTHYRLGYIYYALGEFTKAVSHFQKSTILNPGSYEAYLSLGDSLRELGEIQEAISVYRRGLSVNPKRPEVHTSLAYMYWFQNRHKEAIAEYEQAFRLGEEDWDAYRTLCDLYLMTSEFTKAEDCLTYLLYRQPTDILAQQLLSQAQRNIQLQRMKPR